MNKKRLQDISEMRVGCLFSVVSVMSVPFVAIGGLFVVLGFQWSLEQTADNAATRQVEATILSSRVRHSSGDGGSSYSPVIEFTYELDGQTLKSDRVRPMAAPFAKDVAQEIVKRHPEGSTTQAWLPDRPGALAFLEKGWHFGSYASMMMGLVAWGFCGGLLTVAGGWRWVTRSRLAGFTLTTVLVGLNTWAVVHAQVHLPAETGRVWLIPFGLFVLLTSLLPSLGAWQANRIARQLATFTPQTTEESDPTNEARHVE